MVTIIRLAAVGVLPFSDTFTSKVIVIISLAEDVELIPPSDKASNDVIMRF